MSRAVSVRGAAQLMWETEAARIWGGEASQWVAAHRWLVLQAIESKTLPPMNYGMTLNMRATCWRHQLRRA
eukprot:7327930-Pyramimonas_sp.AAC.1